MDVEIYHYALEGKLIELDALMLVDHEEVLSLSLHQSSITKGSLALRQLIKAETALLLSMEMRLKHSDKYKIHQACREKLQGRICLLQLFDIFENAGSQLTAYVKLEQKKLSPNQLFEEVARILLESGYTLKDGDMVVDTDPFFSLRSYDLTTENGAKFVLLEDISVVFHDSGPISQLRVAIEKLRHHEYLKDWSCKMSIFKLLYILFLPEVIGELLYMDLPSSAIEEIGLLGCYYVKEGKVIELAALLMVAYGKLMPQPQTGPQ